MIIYTPKLTQNFLLLRKGGYKLFDSNINIKKSYNFPCKNIDKSINTSKEIVIHDENNIKNKKSEQKIFLKSLTSKTFSKNKVSKFPKLENYKKQLFRKNILSTEKSYLLEDYMRKKELDLINCRNKKSIYEIRKTFFTEDKIKNNDIKRSYFFKPHSFDKNHKFTLMIKDIESNFILLKNKKIKKFKSNLTGDIESEKNSFKDFNEKLGVKNVYFKIDRLFKRINPMFKSNLKFFSNLKYFNTFSVGNN